MDERDMRGMDGRRLPPRNSRGEFMSRGRGRGRGGRSRGDYGEYRGEDMRGGDYAMDGHYPQGQGATYYPIQAMGTFEGYYGMPEQDYGRGRRDYGMNDYRGGYGRRDYGDYGYDDYGDYGETLSEKELEHWNKKLMEQLDEREKQMFSKEAVIQRAKSMGVKMEGFGEKELYTTVLMVMSDYKKSIGANLDLSIKLAVDWLQDQDAAYKGAEKLAMYKDYIVDGGED